MKRPTVSELWNTPFVSAHLEQARDYAIGVAVDRFFAMTYSGIAKVESPLEAAFLAWWLAVVNEWPPAVLRVEPQEVVNLDGAIYRLDFSVKATPNGYFAPLVGHVMHPKIALELDGHEFHERTPEQVTYRNRRDRALTLAGWTTLHFSGSEFHRNPQRVVRDEAFVVIYECFQSALGLVSCGKGTVSAPAKAEVDA